MVKKSILREIRHKYGLSQGEVADKLDVSRATVNRWEQGLFFPALANVKRIRAFIMKLENDEAVVNQVISELLHGG